LLNMLERDVFSQIMHVDHPRFFAFVPSPSNYIGVIASLLATGHNVFAGNWLEASAATEIELVTIDWLRELCGLPSGWSGLFTSGGSMATLTALAAACHASDAPRSQATVYFSDQTHSSVRRALKTLGLRDDQMREIATARELRLSPDALRAAIGRDRAAGQRPLAMIANAGATNSGAVDPLEDLAALANSEQVWLHVDAAYGGAAMLSPKGRSLLFGLEQAHSISLDPHKWLFQPFDAGCLLVRDVRPLENAFRVAPEYLQDAAAATDKVNFCDRGIELTRPFRALKLWLTFKAFGRKAISDAVQRGIELAEFAEAEIRTSADLQIVTPAQLGIVTFRYQPPHRSDEEIDGLNRSLAAALIEDGFAMMSTTKLFGRPVGRFCTINPRTTQEDIRRTIAKLIELGNRQAESTV
jgi:glutamate/tyrosine decarboxylase-like PLP-dependent enzyme